VRWLGARFASDNGGGGGGGGGGADAAPQHVAACASCGHRCADSTAPFCEKCGAKKGLQLPLPPPLPPSPATPAAPGNTRPGGRRPEDAAAAAASPEVLMAPLDADAPVVPDTPVPF